MFPNVPQQSESGEYVERTIENMILTGTQGSSGDRSFAHQRELTPIEIDVREKIWSVAFLVDGKHVVSGGSRWKIRRWRVEDGKEVQVGTPMDAGSRVLDIAVSRDGKWVVSGTLSGLVTVWNGRKFKGHNRGVNAVDVSPDGTRITTGSDDCTLCVWSLSTGERLLPPLEHDFWVVAVKFSPDGSLIATATWARDLRVYDSQNGGLLVKFPVKVYSAVNQSLAWASNSKQLFALSRDGDIHCLDVSTGTTLSKWAIHSSYNATCIALASNGTFIVASANSSVSFWDTTTHERIGSVIKHTHSISSMAVSANYDLVTGGDKTITLWHTP